MNTSTSPLPRDPQVQSRIQKIRAFSRKARNVCAVLLGVGLVCYLMGLLIVPFVGLPATPERLDGTTGDLLNALLTPLQLKLWWVVSYGAVMGCQLAVVYQLFRLFGNLATGSIYTPENVRRVGRVGLLLLALAILHVVLPNIALAVAKSLAEGSVTIVQDPMIKRIGQSFSAFAAAGLVLLASWVMDVGLYEKEHAEELRHDADLMI